MGMSEPRIGLVGNLVQLHGVGNFCMIFLKS